MFQNKYCMSYGSVFWFNRKLFFFFFYPLLLIFRHFRVTIGLKHSCRVKLCKFTNIQSCKNSPTQTFSSVYWSTLASEFIHLDSYMLKSAETLMLYINKRSCYNPVLINKVCTALGLLKLELNMSKHKIQMFPQKATHRRLTPGDLTWAVQGSVSSHSGCPQFTQEQRESLWFTRPLHASVHTFCAECIVYLFFFRAWLGIQDGAKLISAAPPSYVNRQVYARWTLARAFTLNTFVQHVHKHMSEPPCNVLACPVSSDL